MDIRVGSLCPDLHAEETKEDYEAHHEGEGGKLQPGEVDAPAAPHDDEVIIMTATSRAARHAAPLDARRVIVSLLAFIAFFELGGLVGMLGPSLPSLSARLGRRETDLGPLFTARGVGYLVGSYTVSLLSNHKKHMLMVTSLLLAGASTLCAALIPRLPALLSFLLLQGFGLGAVDVTGNAVLLEIWAKQVDPWMQALHACFGIGSVVSPVMVGFLDYRPSFLILAAISTLPALGVVIQDYLPRAKIMGSPSPAIALSPSSTTGDSVAREEDKSLGPMPLAVRVLVCCFFFVYVGCEVGFGGWVATDLLTARLTSSEGQAAYTVSIFWGGITVGRLLAVPLAVYLRAATLIKLQLTLSLAAALTFLFTGHTSLPIASTSAALLGLGLSSLFPLMLTLPAELNFLVDLQTTGHFLVGSCLGEALLPAVIGLWMKASSSNTNILGLAVTLCTGTLVAILGMVLFAVRWQAKDRPRGSYRESVEPCDSDSALVDPLLTSR